MEFNPNTIRKEINYLKRECQRQKATNKKELRQIKRKLKDLIIKSFRSKRYISLMKYLQNLSTVEKLLGNDIKANYLIEMRAPIGYRVYLEGKRMIKLAYERCSEIYSKFQTFLLQPVRC